MALINTFNIGINKQINYLCPILKQVMLNYKTYFLLYNL